MLTEEEVQNFEQENGTQFVDLFAEENNEPIVLPNTPMDGKTVQEISTIKDIGEGIANGIYGGIRSLVELAAVPVYKTTLKVTTGDWGDASEMDTEFSKTFPQEAEAQTTAGQITQGLAKFGTSTAIAGGAGKLAGLTGKGGAITNASIKLWSKSKDGIQVGKILAPALNGMVGDATAFWQDKENLSNIINKNVSNPYIKGLSDYLAIKEDDDVADRMLKQSLEGLFTAGAANAMFRVLKGVKNAGKAAITNARLARQSEKFGEELMALNAEEVKEAVKSGKMIEPRAETMAVGERTNKVNIPTTEEINEARKEAQEMGISVPRNPERISVEEAERNVAQRIIDAGWAEADVLTEEQLKTLSSQAQNMVEEIIPKLANENKVFIGSLKKMKEAGKAFVDGEITKADRDQHFFNALRKVADAFGSTQDTLYKSGKTLGYVSKKDSHKAIKDVLKSITENADELTKDKIFDIFSSANTVEELRSKLMKLGYMDSSAFKGGMLRNASTAVTALEQAGLMSSLGTVFRNIFTSAEMAVENIATKTLGGVYSKGNRFARRLFNLGEPVSGIESKEALAALGAYWDSIKDMSGWFIDRLVKRDWKSAPQSFVGQYRNSASRQAMTNLPKEIGTTFKTKGFLNKLAEKYVKFSGVNVSEKIDNFFEATFFRGEARARSLEYAERIGRQKGLSEKQINQLYKQTLDRVTGVDLTNRKNMARVVDDIMANNMVEYSIAKKSREAAATATFRSGRGAVTNLISGIMDKAWFLRPMIPFYKTGSTIFFDRFLGDLTPAGLMKFVKPGFRAMMKKGGREAQEYWTRMTIGGGLMATGAMMATEGKITGDYSSDPAVRKAQMAAGFQPNSIVFEDDDGKKTYLSLDYLGPLSMCLKYPAKIMSAHSDYVNSLELEDEDYKSSEATAAMAMAFAKDSFDESALRYFADGFKLLTQTKKASDFIEKMQELGYQPLLNWIPRIASEGINAVKYIDSESIKQGTDGVVDELKKRLGQETFQMYDVFGRPMKDKNPALALLGVKTKEEETEPWLDKLINLGIGFEMPSKSITVPGTNIQIDIDKRQAEGIKKEMGSFNVAKAMKNLVDNKNFDKMPKEIQEKLAKQLFNSFRNNAIMKYYNSDADLQEKYTTGIKREQKKFSVPTLSTGE